MEKRSRKIFYNLKTLKGKCWCLLSVLSIILYHNSVYTGRGADAAKVFVSTIESDLKEIYNKYLKDEVPMSVLTLEEKQKFRDAIVCGICDKIFEDDDVKVRDHCHLTGKVRSGAAHSICNLNYKLPKFIPIVFHNMSGYDCHLFIKELCTPGVKVDVLAQNKEKYISFTKHLYMHDYITNKGEIRKQFLKLRFIDSFKFLSTSLQNLGDNLRNINLFFPDDEKFNLMRGKGVFPYSFVDNLDKLKFPVLPSKEQFFDKLNNVHVTYQDYERAKSVWSLFDGQILGNYSDLYLKADVLLLCDVFENFRKISLEKYKLDPAHYYTAPGLSWDAMLKLTKVELELLTDRIDMIHFLKKGIRGGISQCSERKHIANNQFLPNYNPDEPTSFITYLDATNLYGHSMSQALPTGGFMWLSQEEIDNLDITSISDNSNEGYYIFEVDIHYPQELHDSHADLPFLVETIIPPNSQSKLPKLIPNLNDKKLYVVHYRTLKQAVSNGLVVTRIHRVLKLKKYIDLNTKLRNEATITHWESIRRSRGANALIARTNFKNCSIFSENFVAIHMELSKTVLYKFFYDVIKKEYGTNASLLYTDTDSPIIKILTDNFYEFIRENPDNFDTSNYEKVNQFNIVKSISVLGKMKDEFPADPIISFYGTGAKAYHVQSVGKELKKAKGVKKSVIKQELTLDDYKRVVKNGCLIFRKMNTF
ncbi:hypothetical protein NQ317_016861 [Molorchus minor]|uniref:DNA-directed DNA polymerase n=1 Tax=Molorchus minor TaxID=1323400 RepID=A0ABQ9JKL5_9CUCU|nr:hypothetical protein NQ317_016861 [Molorchus minor]